MDSSDKANVIVACCISICVALVSYNFAPSNCVDEKVKISEQLTAIDKLKSARKYIEAGVCYDFPESDQIVCRNSAFADFEPGKIIVSDLNTEGAVTSLEQPK
jgi:hypothetical protein